MDNFHPAAARFVSAVEISNTISPYPLNFLRSSSACYIETISFTGLWAILSLRKVHIHKQRHLKASVFNNMLLGSSFLWVGVFIFAGSAKGLEQIQLDCQCICHAACNTAFNFGDPSLADLLAANFRLTYTESECLGKSGCMGLCIMLSTLGRNRKTHLRFSF